MRKSPFSDDGVEPSHLIKDYLWMALYWVEYWAGGCVMVLAMGDSEVHEWKILFYAKKRPFVSQGQTLGTFLTKSWTQKAKKSSRSTGISLGKGREGGISLSWLLFPIFAWKQHWKSTFRERNRDFEVPWIYFLVWVSVRFVEGVAVTFTWVRFALSNNKMFSLFVLGPVQ